MKEFRFHDYDEPSKEVPIDLHAIDMVESQTGGGSKVKLMNGQTMRLQESPIEIYQQLD